MSPRRLLCSIGMVFLLMMGLSVGSGPATAADSLTIGIPHSERYPYATMMKQSFEMALKKINREGGIKGRPVKLIYADDRGERDAGEAAIRTWCPTAGRSCWSAPTRAVIRCTWPASPTK